MSFDPNPTVNDSGRSKTDTTNDTAEGNLNDILKQLKIMNLQLAILTDNLIDDREVE